MIRWITLSLLFGFAASTAQAAQSQSYQLHIDAPALKQLVVKSAGGHVRIHASRESVVRIKGQRTMGDASCTLVAKHEGKSAQITVADSEGAPCRIDIDVSAPQNLDTCVESDEGNVFVSGMRHTLNLNLTRGNAVVGGSFPTFTAHLARGSISAQGLGAEATLRLEEGNAQLFFEPNKQGTSHLALDVGTGNVTLTLPASRVALDVSVPTGAIRNALDDAPDAPFKVTGQIGAGSLNIRAAAKTGR
jgi:hypothetical protein